MATSTVNKAKEEIMSLLMDDNVKTVILNGKHGVGKTKMAREIYDLRQRPLLLYDILWVYLNRKYDSRSLHEKIAKELSLPSTADEWEDDDEEEKPEKLETLKQNITTKLKEKARDEGKKFFLVILDDVSLKQDEEEIMSELKTLLPAHEQIFFKFLITIQGNDDTTEKLKKKHHQNGRTKVYPLKPLVGKEAKTLFKERVTTTFFESGLEQLCQAVEKISSGIPAAIITIAEALNYIGQHDKAEIVFLDSVLKEAACDKDSAYYLTRVLHYWYATPDSIMVDCFFHSMQFFRRYGGVHYNELITHWILEGCLGTFDQIEKAYEQGHNVLMELIRRNMLKRQGNNEVVMEGSVLSISDHRRPCFNQIASLGLANMFEVEKWQGFGRITRTDGMIKSLCSCKNRKKVSTILMDGSRLCREDTKTFFQPMEGLQVFAIFNPRFRSLPLSKSIMSKLLVLVLRGCDPLENIADICELTSLCILEISNASLTRIPDDLFSGMLNLQSINLSATNIKRLPTSLFNQRKLRRLILRRCTHLKELQSLEGLENLEVIDLSGAISLETIQDKNFSSLKKLQMLNLSESKIDSLPSFHNIGGLTQPLLSGCSYLTTLPSLETVSSLQVLDLSSARGLEKLEEQSLKNMYELNILDLSGTAIRQLPSTREMKYLEVLDLSGASDLVEIDDQSFSHLRFLRTLNISKSKLKQLPSLSGLKRLQMLNLSGCMNLIEFPHVDALEGLEVIDLSGCSSLKVMKDKSFERLSHLQILDLSETQIEFLPTLPSNLSHLFLRSCTNLTKLSPMVYLLKLVEINLSGARSLGEIKAQFLEGMTLLEILDLSGTQLLELPSMSKLIKLRQLKLRDCSLLKTLQDLEPLKELEILDISATAVGLLPTLNNFSNLQQLLLKDCSQIKDLPDLGSLSHLEVLDISGTAVGHLPTLNNCSNLRQLLLKDCSQIKDLPDLGSLSHLEVLDISGTAVGHLPTLNNCSNLRQLLLKDCSQIKDLPDLGSLSHLEVLDISGTRIKRFPYEITVSTCLKHLALPDLKDVDEVDWGKIKHLPEEVNWDQCGITKHDITSGESKKISMFLSGTNFFKYLEKNPKLLETVFKQFHLFVGSPGKQGEDGNINFFKSDPFFRDVYFHTRHFPEEVDQFLEIHGSYCLPNGFKSILKHAQYLSLIDNNRVSYLSDLGAENVPAMRGCWIEKCSNMKSVLSGEEAGCRVGRNLEILWISNAPSLTSLYSGNLQTKGFENLKHLYLDCCPQIEHVFSSSQLPNNLEIIHVKFCDRLKTLFQCKTEAGSCTLQKSLTVRLFELPEFKSLGMKFQPSHQLNVKHAACPMFEGELSTSVISDRS